MRLAAKLVLLYLVGLSAIVAVFTVLTLQSDRRLWREQHARRSIELTAAIGPAIAECLRRGDIADAHRLLQRASFGLQQTKLTLVQTTGNIHDADPMFRRVRTVFTQSDDRQPRIISTVPVRVDDGTCGLLRIESVPRDANAFSSAMRRSAIALSSVTVLSAAVIAVGGLIWVGRPLAGLIEKVNRIAEGNFADDDNDAVRTGDELGRLSAAIDNMRRSLAEQRDRIDSETHRRIRTVEQLRHADRLRTVGRLAAGIAHEVGTPLAVVSGRADLIARGGLNDNDIRDSATSIKEESDRIADTIRGLLDFARGGTEIQTTPRVGEPVSNDMTSTLDGCGVAETIDSAVSLIQPIANNAGCQIVREHPDQAIVAAIESTVLRQCLTNLMDNAIDADARQIHVAHHAIQDEVEIIVRDDGNGMDASTMEHAFDPFFTTKDVGRGTGLGLSIVYGIINDAGGRIDVESHSESGTKFSIRLPAMDVSDIEPNP